MAKITINGVCKEYPIGMTFERIADEYQKEYDDTIALVIENGKIRELSKCVGKDAELSFITLSDNIGHKTYERSATMLLVKAVSDVVGSIVAGKIKVEFAIGDGYFCSVQGDFKATDELIAKVSARMRELVEMDLPIKKEPYPINEAIALFEKQGMYDKVKLFRYRRSSSVNVYCIDGYYDYYYGYMLPSTGYIRYFELMSYENGILLLLPNQNTPKQLSVFEPREKLFHALYDSTEWGYEMGIGTVGDLNDQICAGHLSDIILVQEALQERKIAEIANEIVNREGIKFVMIAGPSSSGKTSFSHRLSIQLQTHGLKPHPIAVDDYFVEREKTPKDENGDYDFECLEAIDITQFNQDMCDLLAGKEVEIPSFNFKTGHREYNGNFQKLGEDDILVIEGIHGLNDKMSYALPSESKYKIYISALTSINVDGHNRIPTTDGRLLRRMVRDARTRGASAKRTLQMWASVRKGEEKNIFPYQESADVMFNSILIYELAVLKTYAEPLLYGIKKGEPEYYEAQRLLKFLGYFLGIPNDSIPNNSLAKEFVGGSCFNV
ncbi:MAG: nucleoside kinase [Lachnospiraceae bacterium]|nr:nucleoside kinase [Lachnospiraceae bacterium]